MSQWNTHINFFDLMETNNNFCKFENVTSKKVYGEFDETCPEISIVIPTYRGGNLLKEAINSAVHQTVPQNLFEVIVVCDNSEPDCQAIKTVQEINAQNVVCFQNQKNIGMFGNFNRCFSLARTKWVCMLHDDDLVKEDLIEKALRAVKLLNNNDKLGFILPLRENIILRENSYFNIKLSPIERISEQLKNWLSGKNKAICLSQNESFKQGWMRLLPPSCGTLFRREAVINVGGFDYGYAGADHILFDKICRNYLGYAYGESWGYYRWLDNATLQEDTIASFLIGRREGLRYIKEKDLVHFVDVTIWGKVFFLYNVYYEAKRNPNVLSKEFIQKYIPEVKKTITPLILFLYRLRVYPVAFICRIWQSLFSIKIIDIKN